MIKLYRAWTQVDGFMGRDNVSFNWFRINREEPQAPFEELIQDYQPGNLYAEDYVKELFTESELEELRAYLTEAHVSELLAEEIQLPVENFVVGLGAMAVGGLTDFYMLDKEPGYNLSFPVWAFYDLSGCPETVKLSEKQLKAGTEFVRRVLAKRAITLPFDRELEEMAQEIYLESGLYAVQGQTPAEKLAEREQQEAPLADDLPF